MNRNALNWAVQPLLRYGDFSGRSPRAEYWWFFSFQLLIFALLVILAILLPMSSVGHPVAIVWPFLVAMMLGTVALIVPNLAVQVRRFHDQDKSGWFILFAFIPYVGGFLLLIFMALRGTEGENRFGPDPYEDQHLHDVFA